MHSDWYHLFSRFWWLIFPVLGMGMGLVRTVLAHRRANRGLDLIKSYVDQGKEPPAELMEYLRAPQDKRRDRSPANSFLGAIVLAGVAAAFAYIAVLEKEPHAFFIVIIMVGIAIGLVARGLMQRSNENRRELP